MTIFTRIHKTTLVLTAGILLAACSESATEEAGDNLEAAAEDAQRAAEVTADSVRESAGEAARVAEDAAEATRDAATEAGRRLEDACEELTEENC